jgi:Domain of unknown function (DUF4265)
VTTMNQRPTSAGGAKMFKVAFDLQPERPNWPPVSVERLWGEKTAVKFEIRVVNTPFFARGVAYGDLVQVRADHERRELVFEKFTSESGHSTVRIILMGAGARDEVESKLGEAGCSWEGAEQFASLLAVDVPPAVDYRPLRDWLRARAGDGTIEFQESAISSNHRAQLPSFP